ncbi:MAG: DNA circularization N-terminal domain-containing protein [Salinisphaera sp.]|jgi:prophage DNA circulation protein|nr:DNA circularization N-terminal domain-containing protein [Salinisphaera sp.]
MPDWRAQLRKASFRGIEFYYSGAGSDGNGRRVVVHQYPKRDDVDIEDLGANARRFSISGYLLGSQLGSALFNVRDQLEAAFNAAGPGTLVHPHYGAISVHVESAPLSYNTRQGGMVSFEAQFVRASSALPQPRATLDTRTLLAQQADAMLAAQVARFVVGYVTGGQPEFVRRDAARVLNAATDVMGLAGPISAEQAPAQVATALVAGRAALARQGPTIIGNASVFGANLADPVGHTPTAQLEAANQTAIVHLVRLVGLIAGVDAVTGGAFVSFDDAIATRNTLLGYIDTAQLAAADDTLYDQLTALRTALIRDVDQRAGPLARLETYTPRQTLPALVLAWTLYGVANRDAEIINRNAVFNPGFIPGGQPLEVLNA